VLSEPLADPIMRKVAQGDGLRHPLRSLIALRGSGKRATLPEVHRGIGGPLSRLNEVEVHR